MIQSPGRIFSYDQKLLAVNKRLVVKMNVRKKSMLAPSRLVLSIVLLYSVCISNALRTVSHKCQWKFRCDVTKVFAEKPTENNDALSRRMKRREKIDTNPIAVPDVSGRLSLTQPSLTMFILCLSGAD